ncbi:MAG: hypothetical protein ABI791_11145 [Acidobacteriota bacterium]
MLTNFISEAANAIYNPVVGRASFEAIESETDDPIIIRNTRNESREARVTDIYDRARNIYFRAKLPTRERVANRL